MGGGVFRRPCSIHKGTAADNGGAPYGEIATAKEYVMTKNALSISPRISTADYCIACGQRSLLVCGKVRRCLTCDKQLEEAEQADVRAYSVASEIIGKYLCKWYTCTGFERAPVTACKRMVDQHRVVFLEHERNWGHKFKYEFRWFELDERVRPKKALLDTPHFGVGFGRDLALRVFPLVDKSMQFVSHGTATHSDGWEYLRLEQTFEPDSEKNKKFWQCPSRQPKSLVLRARSRGNSVSLPIWTSGLGCAAER